MLGGRKLKAVIPGGSSCKVLPADIIMDCTMDYNSLQQAGSSFGTGAVMVMDETTCMVKVLRRISRFYMAESCGQCTPCREGTGWLYRMLTRILEGKGEEADLEKLVDVANKIEGHTICALGDAAAWPVQSFLKHFHHEFEYMVRNERPQHRRQASRGGGVTAMSDDIVNIEVDGKPVEARKGQMIIEVTDAIGAYVPRFCYHEKLSVAANCRMCLIEVEKAPKPMPACATPVGEGMKIFTKSPKAIAAQKATMEFLLINHPLDCPICDQGGECELQDLAIGYGRDISRYNDHKRVVKDKDIGPLVSTDMTRCIHCTRCVRFGEEITGKPQLGTTGRGEKMEISTYVEQSVDHELSANIIDLCPVGALNNKPYRYSARAWEMMQRATVSPHDCVGSNLYAHVLRGTVKRMVPRVNEAINETWLSDRDRFSYEAIYSADRLASPRIRENGDWRDIDWEDALATAADALRQADAEKIGLLASPAITVEEAHLLAQLADHLGTANIDHRITRRDVTDQDDDPMYPSLGCSIAEIETQDAVLVAGSNIRAEAPIIAHRLRKAALAGADISFVNNTEYEYFFEVADYLAGEGLVQSLAGIAVAAAGRGAVSDFVADICEGVIPTAAAKAYREVPARRGVGAGTARQHRGSTRRLYRRACAGSVYCRPYRFAARWLV